MPDEQRRKKLNKRIDRYADMGYGSCLLSDDRVGTLVENALLHFDDQRYDLLAWCVMSNHVHGLAVPRSGYSLSGILHSWKSYTAHHSNTLLQRTGDFWFADYFDEFMRTTVHMEDTIQYIEFNPVVASLVARPEDWPLSSAAPRHLERVRRNRMRFPEIDAENLPW